MRSKKYIASLVAVAALTTLLLAVPAGWLNPVKYSAWATAVQAFGTVMAFAAAAAALIWQRAEAARRDSETAVRQAEVLDAERKAQALLVSVWLETVDDGSDMGLLRVTIRNGSAMAISRVVGCIVDGRGEPDDFHSLRAAPSEDYVVLFEQIPPAFTAQRSVPSMGGAMGWRPAVQVAFTDAAGRHWGRCSHGPLLELPGPYWQSANIAFDWSWTGVLHDGTLGR